MTNYIQLLGLEKHIEGGYFGVFYRSQDKVMPLDPRYHITNEADESVEERYAGTSIYFLLEKDDFSAWHRLKSDEIWHYYDGGSPIDIHVLDEDGRLTTHTLGRPGVTQDASFQVLVRAGCWFAAEVRDKSSFGLVGCTVSPGFEYQDFELADKLYLINQYKNQQESVNKFIRMSPSVSKSWMSVGIKYATIALISGVGLYATKKFLFNTSLPSDIYNMIQLRK